MSSIDQHLEISENDLEDCKEYIKQTLLKHVHGELSDEDQVRLATRDQRAQRASDDDDNQVEARVDFDELMLRAGSDSDSGYTSDESQPNLNAVLFPVSHLERKIDEHLNTMSGQDVLTFYTNLLNNEPKLKEVVKRVIHKK